MTRTRVLYVAGSGRSGSTLLATVLGSVPGYVCAGELRYVFERGLLQNRSCGCGQPFRSCPFWTEVLDRAFGPAGASAASAAFLATQRRALRARYAPLLLVAGWERSPRLRAEAATLGVLGRLYAAVRDVSGARVVVDSSKLPSYGALLGAAPDVDLSVVHLVRDPRAAAFSWRRAKALRDGGPATTMQSRSAARSALLWSYWNLVAARGWPRGERSLRLRYEDLTADPRASIGEILRLLGDTGLQVPIAAHGTAQIAASHTVAGNPDRFRTGEVVIRTDDEWERAMPARDRLVVSALTAPLRPRFGYTSGQTRRRI